MRVLTTGANGHVGANVARSLLRRGHEVVAFVRRGADLRGLEGLKVEYAYGDIMERESLVEAARNCEAMIHMAAVYRYWNKDPNAIVQAAVDGTRNALTAAKEAGIRRVVYTSTTWAVGLGKRPNERRTAADWNDDPRNPYAVGKVQAEKEAWRLADELKLDIIAICPSGIIGPYDFRLTPSMFLLNSLINGTAPYYKGGQSYVDVHNVADIHVAALEMGEIGRRYIAAGENHTVEEYAQIITKLTGIRPMRLPGGRTALLTIALLSEAGSKITGSEPLISRALADEMGDRYMYFDCADTYRTFGVTMTKAEEAIKEAIRWMLYAGQIKPNIAVRLNAQFPPDPAWKGPA